MSGSKARRAVSVLGLTLVLGAGCGRVVPEGYLQLNIGLQASAPTRSSPGVLGGVHAAATCTVPFLRLTAFDGSAIPPSIGLGATFNTDTYANATAGSVVFETRGALLVRTGAAPRTFVAEGFFYDGCGDPTSAALQMWGVKESVVQTGIAIEVPLIIAAQLTTVASTAAGITTTGGFVTKPVQWTTTPAVSGTVYVHIKDFRADRIFTITTSSTAITSNHFIGPLLRERVYGIVYRYGSGCTPLITASTHAGQLDAPFQPDGSSFTSANCPTL